MSITQPDRNHERPLPADERSPLRLPRSRPWRARPPGRDRPPDPSRRAEPVPMWMAGAAARASAAIEADLRP